MGRLAAGVGARPSTRSTLSGTCVYESVNASDPHPHGSTQENENERGEESENRGNCEKLVH